MPALCDAAPTQTQPKGPKFGRNKVGTLIAQLRMVATLELPPKRDRYRFEETSCDRYTGQSTRPFWMRTIVTFLATVLFGGSSTFFGFFPKVVFERALLYNGWKDEFAPAQLSLLYEVIHC